MTRVGLAGYGSAGRGFHALPIAEAGLDLAAIATSNPDRIARARADVPGAEIVPDLDALLGLDLDVVVLATPSGVHHEQAVRCIEAGRAVVVEKPLATNASDALEVVDTAREAGVPLTVFQNRRFDPQHTTLARVVSSEAIGEIFRMELRWDRWRPVPKDRWRENSPPEAGGGLLLDLQSHLIDEAVQLFGPVASVHAEVASRTTVAEDDTFLVCRHENGVVSHLSASTVVGMPGPRLRLLGRGGAYVLNEIAGEANLLPSLADAPGHTGWIVRGDEREPVPTVPSAWSDFYRGVAAALGAADPQAAMPVDPTDAVHVLAVIDAARTSAAANRVVEVVTPGEDPNDD